MTTTDSLSRDLPLPLNLLSDEDRAVLEQRMQSVAFAAGERIFAAGAEGDTCYLIDEGVVRVVTDPAGLHAHLDIDSEPTLGYIEAGGILGELSLLDRKPRSAGAYADTDVRARSISIADIEALLASHPRAVAALYAALGRDAATKLRRTNVELALAVLPETRDRRVDPVVARAVAAQREIADWPEDRIDALIYTLARILSDRAQELAEECLEESRMGTVDSKRQGALAVTIGMVEDLRNRPGQGVLGVHPERGVADIARPVGVVLGVGPVTVPITVFICQAMWCVKARNALVYIPNGLSRRVSGHIEELIREGLRQHGAPEDLIQCVRGRVSRTQTQQFMSHPDVALIVATSGRDVIQDAYSAGKPALGTGPANTPVLICADADISNAVACIAKSKTFDNGMMCASEHNLVVVESARQALIDEAERMGMALLSPEEVEALKRCVVDPKTNHLKPEVVGQAAEGLAREAGITRSYPIRVLLVPVTGADPANPFAHQKLVPIISLSTVANEDEGLELCERFLQIEGSGHTSVIYTKDSELVNRFAALMPTSRILVNSPASLGMMGLVNGLPPSSVLGCGTDAGNSTTDNVGYAHLLNVKRLASYSPEEAAHWEEIMAGSWDAVGIPLEA